MTSPWQQPDAPHYGEYAPTGQPPFAGPPSPYGESPAQPHPQGSYYVTPPIERKSRTGDVVVTVILLMLGLVGTLLGVLTAAFLPQSLADQYARYGVPLTAPSDLGVLSGVIIVSHVILLLAAVGISIPLLARRRLAFWVPLMFGVVAGIIFWVILGVALFGDGAIFNAIQAQQG